MISWKPAGSVYISQTRLEVGLAASLLAIPLIIIFALIHAKNTATLFFLGILFPLFYAFISAYFYFTQYIVYYDPAAKRIHVRKLLHKTPFESLGLSDLKNPELFKNLDTYNLSFISSPSGKKYAVTIRKETKDLVTSWIEWVHRNNSWKP